MTGLENIDVDITDWPVVCIRYGPFTDAEHEAHLPILLRLLDEHPGQFAAMLDIRNAEPLDARQRKRVVEFWDTHREMLSERVRGLTYVTDKSVLRGVITALNWFVKYPCPAQVHKNVDEAHAWLRACMSDDG